MLSCRVYVWLVIGCNSLHARDGTVSVALSQELRQENNVMDKLWDRKSFKVGGMSLAVVAGMKQQNDHTDPTKVERYKKIKKVRDRTVVK